MIEFKASELKKPEFKINELKKLSDLKIHEELKAKSALEREVLSDVICFIHEVDSRRLYRKFGHENLFQYLTLEMKYSNASAQRRIDAARLLRDVPEIKEDLESGALNLTKLSVLAQGLKQKVQMEKQAVSQLGERLESSLKNASEVSVSGAAKESVSMSARMAELKKQLVQEIKGKSISQAQRHVAETLNIPVHRMDRKTLHADGSVTYEVTLSKEQAALLEETKEILSHQIVSGATAEVFEKVLTYFNARNSPKTKGTLRRAQATSVLEQKETSVRAPKATSMHEQKLTSAAEVKAGSKHKIFSRSHLPNAIRREVFKREECCSWRDPLSGRVCRSKFQLQIDHIKPVWAGGDNSSSNLRLLCSAHNRMKYLRESGQLRFLN